MRLQEKVVLISGAASGIGLAAAQVCAEQRAALVLADLARATGGSGEDALARAALVAPRGVGRLLTFLVSDDADLVRGSVFTR